MTAFRHVTNGSHEPGGNVPAGEPKEAPKFQHAQGGDTRFADRFQGTTVTRPRGIRPERKAF